MNIKWFGALLILVFVLSVGCSEEEKQEAARLEQELIDQEGTQEVAEPAAESPAEETPTMDAEAIPAEETMVLPGEPGGRGYVVQIASCESERLRCTDSFL
jgi:hypothetical protein